MAQRAPAAGAEKGHQQRGTAALAWRSASRARAIPASRVTPGLSVKSARHCASASSIHSQPSRAIELCAPMWHESPYSGRRRHRMGLATPSRVFLAHKRGLERSYDLSRSHLNFCCCRRESALCRTRPAESRFAAAPCRARGPEDIDPNAVSARGMPLATAMVGHSHALSGHFGLHGSEPFFLDTRLSQDL